MTTTKKKYSLHFRGETPGTWFMTKLFEKYASKEFYDKFVEGGYKLTQDIKQEWKSVYMEGNGLDFQDNFYVWAYAMEEEYKTLFKKRKDFLHFYTFIAYMSVVAAPKFYEQLSEEVKSTSDITIIK